MGISSKETQANKIEELLERLVAKAEKTWDEYDDEPDLVKSRYLLGKIRGIEYAISLLEDENA
jgi:hypothetical protein